MFRFMGFISSFCLLFTFVFGGCGGYRQASSSDNEQPVSSVRPLPDIDEMVKILTTNDGCSDFTAQMRMTSVNEGGRSDSVDFKIQRKYKDERVFTFLSVLSPREETDKALLAVGKMETATQAFSYLAGLKKLSKLSSGRQLTFRGARVSVQELLGMELDQYTHNSGDRVDDSGNELIMVDFKEKYDRGLAYPRIVGYFDEDKRLPKRFELFDTKNEIVKNVIIEEVKTIRNHRTITRVAIEDLNQKLKLSLQTRAVEYDTGIPDNVFTESHLINLINSASRIVDTKQAVR